MNYERTPVGEYPAPPGVSLPAGFPSFGDLAKQLGLPTLGLYTPWGARSGGTTWEPVKQPPDTNVAVFGINDALLNAAQVASFGQPVPFVAIVTDAPISEQQIDTALAGTPYRFYQTQGVYSQTDSAPTPRILFMHWAENRQPGDGGGGGASVEKAAAVVGGKLVYATQVNYATTRQRQPPSVPFTTALTSQLQEAPVPPGPPPPVPPPSEPPTEPPPQKASMAVAALFGTGVAVATYFVVRSARKGK